MSSSRSSSSSSSDYESCNDELDADDETNHDSASETTPLLRKSESELTKLKDLRDKIKDLQKTYPGSERLLDIQDDKCTSSLDDQLKEVGILIPANPILSHLINVLDRKIKEEQQQKNNTPGCLFRLFCCYTPPPDDDEDTLEQKQENNRTGQFASGKK